MSCGNWQPNPEAKDPTQLAMHHLSLCLPMLSSAPPYSQLALLTLPLKMDEKGPKKAKYASEFQSFWCENLQFLTTSNISKHHIMLCMFCKLCQADFSDFFNIWHFCHTIKLHYFILPAHLFEGVPDNNGSSTHSVTLTKTDKRAKL